MILYVSIALIVFGISGVILRRNLVMAILALFTAMSGVAGLMLSVVLARSLENYAYFPYLLFITGFDISLHGLLLVKNYFHETRDIMLEKIKLRLD